ncbi:MAG: hypothetical protein Q7R49_03595 [Candidatus Daviesbacteria bacterium]|nr:hypothetical protein [Candidatus Daviesbacteria bacterium]
MSERFIVPKTSPEIAQQVYLEVAEDTNAFIRREAQVLETENPFYLGAILRGATMVSVLEDCFPAQQIMAGTFFRYECTRRELERVGSRIPPIGILTIQKKAQEVKQSLSPSPLLIITSSPETPTARLTRLRIARINKDDPIIGEVIKKLTRKPYLAQEVDDVYSFIEGVHGAHLDLALLEPAEPLVEPDLPETQAFVIPQVRGAIARAALLETILDPAAFVDQTSNRLSDYAPGMANKISRGPSRYQLLANLTSFCLMEEFQRRGRKFPTIGRTEIKHPDPEIARLLELDQDELLTELLLRQFNKSILNEIAGTNPKLSWVFESYLNPLQELIDLDDGEEYADAINGIVNAYTTIKAGLA